MKLHLVLFGIAATQGANSLHGTFARSQFRAQPKQCLGVRERCSGVRSVRAFGFKTFGPCFGLFVLFGTVLGLFGVLFCSVFQGMCFVRLFCSGVSTHCEFVRLF